MENITDPKEIVRKGYDDLGDRYVDGPWDKDEYFGWLDELASGLKPDTNVLELGCNVGVPTARKLSATHQVTGVDLSPVAVSLARANVPDATFVVADMAEVDFPDSSFSAVVAFYSIPHLPLEEQPLLFDRIGRWLEPGGYFMGTLHSNIATRVENDWLQPGVTMYWSHTDEDTYVDWLNKAGLSILWSRFIPEGDGGHPLVLAQKPYQA